MKKIIIFLIPFFLFAEIIKFNNLKNSYFENQIVNLNGRIVLQKEINLTAIPSENMEVNLTKINPYVYKINISFQANNNEHKLILIGKNFYNEIDLNKIIKIKKLNAPKNFSGIYAYNFKILNPIASKYDKNKNILSFTIKCNQCNLNDFNLSSDQNLTLKNNTEATYYILLPKYQKKLDFYYFDLNTSSFKKVSIPVILKQHTISTQTNVNPEGSKFFTPINILILFLIAFGLIVFIVYQKIWILIFPLILSGFLIYQYVPKGKIVLAKNTKIQILPTPQSTVIYITPKKEKAEVLFKKDGYIKVKINNKIGWVKNENN
ncbi:hypothetical protein [Caminibacter sp.]